MTGTPIRSRNDPTPASTDSSEELEPSSQTPPSTGATDGDGAPAGDPPADTDEARNRRYIGILEDTLREQNRTIQTLQNHTAAPAAPAAPPARDPNAERQEFYNDPLEATRRVIRDELKETVAPLLSFVSEMRGQGTVGRLKEMVKADPKFAPMWDAAVERAVDDTLARVAPENINEQIVRSATVQAIGLKAMGLLEGASAPPAPNPNPTPTPTGERRVATPPPHMRPSAPPAPSGNNNGTKALRPLTENEERLRREQKMTHADFLFWLELPANEVATAVPPSKRAAR